MEHEFQPVAAEEETTPAPDEDFDSAFAWLESLAARQGADENTLITPPDQRNETTPEWVQVPPSTPLESTLEIAIESAELPEAEVYPAQVDPLAAAMPVMLSIEPALAASEQVPDWLQSIEEETPAEELDLWKPETENIIEIPVMDQVKRDELPDWLRVEALENQPAVSPEPAESVPDWLSSIAEEEPGPLAGEPEPSVPTNDIRLAWEPEASLHTPVEEVEPVFSTPTTANELQEALNRGNIDEALEGYNQLIQNGDRLTETIHALRESLYRYPVDISIWQTLGDAYARNNQLQEALDAYTKAEELLR
jgi:tetratricopeptide (TPR) repeat protein